MWKGSTLWTEALCNVPTSPVVRVASQGKGLRYVNVIIIKLTPKIVGTRPRLPPSLNRAHSRQSLQAHAGPQAPEGTPCSASCGSTPGTSPGGWRV